MIRAGLTGIGVALVRHANRERYPTRSVEHMLAWMILVWSATLLLPGPMLAGPSYKFLTIIMPESAWGSIGVLIGAARLFALARNGGWKRSPALRFIGAMFGLIWWLILFALYSLAVNSGAPDFPMRMCFLVFIGFEAYSCYRCGQDHATATCGKGAVEADG